MYAINSSPPAPTGAPATAPSAAPLGVRCTAARVALATTRADFRFTGRAAFLGRALLENERVEVFQVCTRRVRKGPLRGSELRLPSEG